jgi:hypothetical protein
VSAASADWSILGRAVGVPASEVEVALGDPEARRTTGSDRWLVFRAPGVRLRVRCAGSSDEAAVVASWSLTFESGFQSLREATEPFGLWPACAPDETASTPGGGLIRRAITRGSSDARLTLTATVRGNAIQKLDLFDEEPDWL